eukprot:sb/3462191/
MPKRKNPSGGPVFFAVTAGWKPGIYTNYDDVLTQIRSFTKPAFRRFERYSDAVTHYFHTTNTEDLVRKLEEKATETYVRLIKGGQNDPDVVSQFCNSAFDNLEAAAAADYHDHLSQPHGDPAIRRSERAPKMSLPGSERAPKMSLPGNTPKMGLPGSTPKMSLPGSAGVAVGPAPSYSSTQFEQEIMELLDGQGDRLERDMAPGRKRFKPPPKEKPPPTREREGEVVTRDGVRVIYVDGCCNNNQDPSTRKAGCGVWWGDGDARNITERLWGEQTNQRAEIWAAIRGLQTALQSGFTVVEIRTDSHYVIKAATEWIARWKNNGWKASNRQPVKHQDLWVLLDQLQHYIEVRWVKVKGHAGVQGNEKADALAKNGADLPAREVYSLPGQPQQPPPVTLTTLTPPPPPPPFAPSMVMTHVGGGGMIPPDDSGPSGMSSHRSEAVSLARSKSSQDPLKTDLGKKRSAFDNLEAAAAADYHDHLSQPHGDPAIRRSERAPKMSLPGSERAPKMSLPGNTPKMGLPGSTPKMSLPGSAGVAVGPAPSYSSTQFEQEIMELLDGQGDRLERDMAPGRKRFKPPPKEKPLPTREREGEVVTRDGVRVIYVDGCCNNNQDPSTRKAGCGVWWGDGDARNITERLWGEQTNQRAEIWAAIRGLQTALQSGFTVVEIRTDSHYVIKAATEWIARWKNNGWKASNRQPVKHQDLWVLLDQLQHYIEVRWVKVKGHAGVQGNEKADALAKNGADLPAREVYSLPGQPQQPPPVTLTTLTPPPPPPPFAPSMVMTHVGGGGMIPPDDSGPSGSGHIQ